MYPSDAHASDGIFVKRQIDALTKLYAELAIEVCYIDTVRGKSAYLFGALAVWRALKRFSPDVVHIHYGLTQLMCWPIFRTPVVVTLHGSDLTIPWQRAISRAMFRERWKLVVVSDKLREYLPAYQDTTTVPCGVDAKKFCVDRDQARRSLCFSADERVILFGSNPKRSVKRYDRFEAVAAVLMGRLKNIRTVRLSDVSVNDAPSLIAASDVLVLTSDREGSPIVTKEALCSGTRVVSTPVGDISMQLQGFSGCRVSSWDTNEIASHVVAALGEDRPDNARAADLFDHAVECSRIVGIYRSLLAV